MSNNRPVKYIMAYPYNGFLDSFWENTEIFNVENC